MALFKRGNVWWYEFMFAGRRIQESAKTRSKSVARLAEQKRRRELEEGFNNLSDTRRERIKTFREPASAYLEDYALRHRSLTFAQYAITHLNRHVGEAMIVDISEEAVIRYQSERRREGAAPKTINEEVGFLLRVLGPAGDTLRSRLRRRRSLKLPVEQSVGKAFDGGEKAALLKAAATLRSPAIYPALMLALNAGMRDAEIRNLQWDRLDLKDAVLAVGRSKTAAGEGRTIPLNTVLLTALRDHAKWFEQRFGEIRPEWYVFPYGKPQPTDPTRPITTLKTAWNRVRATAGVSGRWHDSRHTFITDCAEAGVPDEVVRDMAGHVSKQMLKHYSHIRMQAKRGAVEKLTGQA